MYKFEKIIKYAEIGDKLEYGNITDKEAAMLCNNIIHESILENDRDILEEMYHSIFTGICNHKIADKLDVNVIIDILDKFDEEVSDYTISILSFADEKKYSEIIKKIGLKYKNLDINNI